jgi:hypothetical protein
MSAYSEHLDFTNKSPLVITKHGLLLHQTSMTDDFLGNENTRATPHSNSTPKNEEYYSKQATIVLWK